MLTQNRQAIYTKGNPMLRNGIVFFLILTLYWWIQTQQQGINVAIVVKYSSNFPAHIINLSFKPKNFPPENCQQSKWDESFLKL